jgi:FixJ family two-component response regulator
VREAPLIAIVDDDESIRDAVRSLIRSVGYRAEVFTLADEFLSSGHVDDTACLILDVRMPGMSGLELQRQLALANYRIPVIFITAHADADTQARALAAGAVAFLSKPFDEAALLDAIRSAVGS